MLIQELYLVRHGETDLNARRMMQGTIDEPLNASGRLQAAALRDFLFEQGIIFDHACCSRLKRAAETLCILTDLPHEELAELGERSYGSCEGMPVSSAPPVPYGDFFVPYGGESDKQVFQRMDAVTKRILSQPCTERVLAVSHGAAIRSLLAGWSGVREAPHTVLPNCGAVVCRFHDHALYEIIPFYPQSSKR